MAKIIEMPKLSPTMEEGTLVKWYRTEGDVVAIDDLLAEVETDKATMEFRAFDKGVLLKRLVPEGATVKLGAPVAILGAKGEDVSALVARASGVSAQGAQAPAVGPAAPRATEAAAAPEPAVRPAATRKEGERVLASPLVRRIARESEVDLGDVEGTGPNGRIVKRDLDVYLSSPRRPEERAASAPAGALPSRVVPLTSMRKTIARRMVESKTTVPHFYLTIDVDAGPLVGAQAALNAELAAIAKAESTEPEKVSVNDLLIKAAAVCLRRVPAVNASYSPDGLVFHSRVDVSVAVALDDGLVTPVVRDADALGVLEIGREVRALAKAARAKKLKPEQMQDGTFSISNLGMFGIDEFAAVINPPEGAILAVGQVRDEPVVAAGAVVAGKRLRLTLSCDHRVVDGAVGARYLQVLRRLLETPATMLL
ncbi:MAG: 2-oxo acid dehydrogenase subunit E2 [Deltaproteobacteria bacterium]|nr:2-oxo acid dehydrogenase subunit E2 [Deltaproteobacteria bacterium]